MRYISSTLLFSLCLSNVAYAKKYTNGVDYWDEMLQDDDWKEGALSKSDEFRHWHNEKEWLRYPKGLNSQRPILLQTPAKLIDADGHFDGPIDSNPTISLDVTDNKNFWEPWNFRATDCKGSADMFGVCADENKRVGNFKNVSPATGESDATIHFKDDLTYGFNSPVDTYRQGMAAMNGTVALSKLVASRHNAWQELMADVQSNLNEQLVNATNTVDSVATPQTSEFYKNQPDLKYTNRSVKSRMQKIREKITNNRDAFNQESNYDQMETVRTSLNQQKDSFLEKMGESADSKFKELELLREMEYEKLLDNDLEDTIEDRLEENRSILSRNWGTHYLGTSDIFSRVSQSDIDNAQHFKELNRDLNDNMTLLDDNDETNNDLISSLIDTFNRQTESYAASHAYAANIIHDRIAMGSAYCRGRRNGRYFHYTDELGYLYNVPIMGVDQLSDKFSVDRSDRRLQFANNSTELDVDRLNAWLQEWEAQLAMYYEDDAACLMKLDDILDDAVSNNSYY